jgi:hypothetical protein
MMRLAAELLELASEQFSNHGCNDFERPAYFTPKEWLAIETEFELWNSVGRDPVGGNMGDSALMTWLATLIEAEIL